MNEYTEYWKDIANYEGVYLVSNTGRVKSMDRIVPSPRNSRRKCNGKIISPGLGTSGYHFVWLHKDGIRLVYQVHRLVCAAFHPNPENKPTVNHKNGIKTDNNEANLEWSSMKEQSDHKRNILKRGLKPGRKISDDDVLIIREMYSNRKYYQHQIAALFGVSQTTVGAIVRRKSFSEI